MKSSIFKRIFSRKMLTRLAFTLVVFMTLVMIFYRVEAWRGERAWETYRKAAEARGVKLWLKDFVTPSIPDEQNYAAIPFFKLRFGSEEEAKAAAELLPQLTSTAVKRPSVGAISGAPSARIEEWRDYLVKLKLIPAPSENAARDIISAFEKIPGLQQLRDAASRPQCRFPVQIEKGFAATLPHLGPIQQAGFYFHLDAEARIAAGDRAGALDDCMQIFRLSDAARTDPFLISLLVRISILEKAELLIRRGLVVGIWKEDDLAVLERRVAAQNLVGDYRIAMASERAGMTTEFERLARSTAASAGETWSALSLPPAGGAVYPRGWLYMSMVKGNELHDAWSLAIAPIDGAEPEFIAPRVNGGPLRELSNLSSVDRFRYALVVLMMPVLDSIESSLLRASANLAQTRIACALERARLSNGGFPETLAGVAAHFGGSIPKDICDGKPMRYRRTADGYELWSVGVDRVDDGGRQNPDESESKKQPDWLWKLVLGVNPANQ